MTDAGMTLTETQEEGAPTKVAINFPSRKKITYETMHIASEATHDETQWKFRMPGIEHRLKNRIKITSALAKEIKLTAEMENVITYQECTLGTANSSVELTDAQPAQNSLQCFSFAIPNKGPYLSYVAGNWYASISNPFKFVSSDSRRSSLKDIATKIKNTESDTMMFFVERKNVARLVAAIVPSFQKSTPFPHNYIHKDLLHWKKHHIREYAVYNLQKQYCREFQKQKLSEETIKAIQTLDKIYYEFVSLRPVWDNRERFDALCRGARIDNFSSQLDTISLTPTNVLSASQISGLELESNLEQESDSDDLIDSDGEEDREEESEDDSEDDGEDHDDKAGQEPNYNISYQDLLTKSKAEDTIQEYTNSYVETILKKLNVLDEDKESIIKDFFKNYEFGEPENDFSINGLINAMANRANVSPNKFQFLQNMVKGITKTTINIEEEQKKKLGDLEKQIQDNAALISTAKLGLPGSEKQLSQLEKKLIDLNRQFAAFRNPLWIALESNLNKIGIKPTQRAFPKPNFVFSFAEFIIMLKKFSNIEVDENNKDFEFLRIFAKYVRSKVWGSLEAESEPAANDIILALNTIYSKEGCTEFKEHMQNEHDISIDFPQFMATLVSVHFITNEDTSQILKARTTTRFNGLRLALRYDMFVHGVNIIDLNEKDFEQIPKLCETNNGFIFEAGGTKQKGFYIKAPDATPVTPEVNNALVQRNWALRNRETAKVYQYYAREPKWNNWSRAYIRGNREETIGKLEVVKFVDSDELDTRCIK
jgi:hypothetical protein